MAFFRVTPVNPNSARHELHYVNQQYVYLFGIRWDEARKDYASDVSEAEASGIAKAWGGGRFDFNEALAWARQELPLMDSALTLTAGTRR